MDPEDFSSLNLDDPELITASDKGLEWNVGDYCRSLNPVDGRYREAKVISVDRGICSVEILGEGNIGYVKISTLKKSDGKKARKEQIKAYMESDGKKAQGEQIKASMESDGKNAQGKQIKASMGDSYDGSSSSDESESDGDTTDASCNLRRKKKSHLNQRANNATMYEAASHQQYPAPAPSMANYTPPMPSNFPFMPPATMPQYATPPAPPMPQCPGLANNSAFSSLPTAFYMAGYYMGINSVQKENHGSQRCCNLSNPCHHN